jgi:hypothetical protein
VILNGPSILKANHKINFIVHLEKSEPFSLYFNSKGLNLNIYTQMVKEDEFKDQMVVPFPTK